MGFLLTTCRRN